jgi:hypothetical protein
MQNRTEAADNGSQHDQTAGSGATVGKPSEPAATFEAEVPAQRCPSGTSWCVVHEADGDYCWSRTIQVREAGIAMSNGTITGRPKVWGLDEFEDCALELDVATEVVAAITALLAEAAR